METWVLGLVLTPILLNTESVAMRGKTHSNSPSQALRYVGVEVAQTYVSCVLAQVQGVHVKASASPVGSCLG